MKNSTENTIIIRDEIASSITASPEIMICSVCGQGKGYAVIGSILNWIKESKISINMTIVQKITADRWSLSFSCSAEYKDFIMNSSELNMLQLSDNLSIEVHDKLSEICISGVGMSTTPGVIDRIIKALQKEDIHFYHATSSEISVSVTVSQDNAMKAIIALNTAFGI